MAGHHAYEPCARSGLPARCIQPHVHLQALAHTLSELVLHSSTRPEILEPRERERALAHLLAVGAATSPTAGGLVHERLAGIRDVLPIFGVDNKAALVRALVPAARRTIAAGVDRGAAAALVQQTRRRLDLPVALSPQAATAATAPAAGAADGDDGEEDDETASAAGDDGDSAAKVRVRLRPLCGCSSARAVLSAADAHHAV